MRQRNAPTPAARHLRRLRDLACLLAAGSALGLSVAGTTDLATAPLQTSVSSLVKPNILFVLDDSGSMAWDFMPDWVSSASDDALIRNSAYNGVYYNPAFTYSPPINYDNATSRVSMTASQTSNWTRVPFDGYYVQTASATGGNNLFTDGSSGATQDLTPTTSARYYTFVPGEYCSTPKLKTCVAQTSSSNTYPYPALLRWCSSSALSNCQANRVDVAPTGGSTYLFPRYPGQTITSPVAARATVRFNISFGTGTVSNVTVGGVSILPANASGTTSNSLAQAVVDAINLCTTAATGRCGVAGYSATRSSNTVTLTAPASQGALTTTPVYTVSGAGSVSNITAFSGGVTGVYVPGSNVRTLIQSGTNSYPYPGSSSKAAGRTDCAASTCTYAEEMTNFANWWAYYRTRMQMTKSAASIAFAALDNKYRLGYVSINNNTGSDFLNIGDIDTTAGTTGQKAQWYTKFTSASPNSSTPLRVALSTAGRYYAGKLKGVTFNGSKANDPMQYACQRNYTILSTDGYWNESNNPTQINGSTAIGDVDSATSISRPYLDSSKTGNTLSDVAYYYYNTDIRDKAAFSNDTGALGTDVASNTVADQQQRMYTSTVGLGASGYMLYQSNYATAKTGDYFDVLSGTTASATTANAGVCSWQVSGNCNWPKPTSNQQTTIDDLWHAAVNGRGNFYSAANPNDLKTGLNSFLLSVQKTNANAAAATTSNPNVAAGDNYVFKSTFQSVTWFGELSRYTIDTGTGALSTVADWSQSGTTVATQATANAKATYTPPLLDQMAYTARKIYTYDPGNAVSTLLPFTWDKMPSSMQALFNLPAINSLSQMCSSGSNCLPSSARVNSTTAGSASGAGGINLVNFLRGDRSNEGPDTGTYYFQRTHVLGDIVDSQSVYVKAPQFKYADTGYSEFRAANANRQGMIYVGANDGMLHAFNATDGSESWAYIPSLLLPKLYKLADKNYASNHTYYVNATPRQGDVYFDSDWHTILVGGFGAGGRGFFALDVTTPDSPKVLWEFTHDTSKGAGYTKDADMGYSYGTPLISKLSDGTWVVIVSSGYNNVSPGSGRGIVWVLNAKTGAVIKKIDTGFGTGDAAATPVSGCTASPCPAGLAKLSAYVSSADTDNRSLRVYGGDLYGNVWRFDLSSLTGSGGNAPVQLLTTLTDSSGKRQPVTARPEVGNVSGQAVVYVGTGAYLGVPDLNTNPQAIYAIKDNLTQTTLSTTQAVYSALRSNLCDSSTKTDCFVKQTLTDTAGVRTATSTVNYSPDFATMNGWFADLPETGERMNTDPDLQLGTLAFTTNIPSSSDACSIGGSSYINFLDYRTGLNIATADRVGTLLSNGTSTALASAATLVRLPNGKVIAITNLSDGTSVTTQAPTPPGNQRTRRVSWRELLSDR